VTADPEWPDEPEEYDPEQRWGSPERDLPKTPSVRVPDATPGEDATVDSDLQRSFWAAVVLANVAVFGLAVGPMLVYFRGTWLLGAGLFGLGVVALARTYAIARSVRTSSPDEADAAGDGD
jgi:hypothetical protein